MFCRDANVDDNNICFEFPLNERIRTLLRLEFMFAQMDYALTGDTTRDTRYALQTFFETFNIITRNELKSDLLQELDRHHANLSRLAATPAVDTAVLNDILSQISECREALNQAKLVSPESVRQNEFLNALRQRTVIPGGTCSFDLPAFHHWLEHNPTESRRAYIDEWRRPFTPLNNTVSLILGLIRESAVPEQEVAKAGYFQKALDAHTPVQMSRVIIDRGGNVFPELSGGKHRISVRFLEQPNPNARATQAEWDIPFKLVCCVI